MNHTVAQTDLSVPENLVIPMDHFFTVHDKAGCLCVRGLHTCRRRTRHISSGDEGVMSCVPPWCWHKYNILLSLVQHVTYCGAMGGRRGVIKVPRDVKEGPWVLLLQPTCRVHDRQHQHWVWGWGYTLLS